MEKINNITKLIVGAKDEKEAEAVVDVIERQAIEKLYERGDIIILPGRCRIGDNVYFIIEDIEEVYISVQKVTDVSLKGFFVASSNDDEAEFIPFSEVGRNLFLNFERAVRELKRIKKEKFILSVS